MSQQNQGNMTVIPFAGVPTGNPGNNKVFAIDTTTGDFYDFLNGAWHKIASGGGSGTPGGVPNQVQFNNAGSFSGIPDGTTGQVLVSNGPGATAAFVDPIVSGPAAEGATPVNNPVWVSGKGADGKIHSVLTANDGTVRTDPTGLTTQPVSLAAAPSTPVTNAGLTNIDVALSTRTKPGDQQHAIIDSGSTVVTQGTGSNLHVAVDSAPSTAVTNAGLTNLDVALSTRTKPGDQQHAIIDSGTTVVTQGTGTNLHVVVDSAPSTTVTGTVTAQQATGTNLHVVVDTAPSTAVTNVGTFAVQAGVPALGQALAASSLPVVLTAAQLTTLTPPAVFGGVVTQATGTNLHVVVDTAPSTAVTNAGLSNLDVLLSTVAKDTTVAKDSSLTTINSSLGTLDTDLKATQPRSIVGTVTVSPTNSSLEHNDIWVMTGYLSQILIEIRALRVAFSAVTGQYVGDDDDVYTQVQ